MDVERFATSSEDVTIRAKREGFDPPEVSTHVVDGKLVNIRCRIPYNRGLRPGEGGTLELISLKAFRSLKRQLEIAEDLFKQRLRELEEQGITHGAD